LNLVTDGLEQEMHNICKCMKFNKTGFCFSKISNVFHAGIHKKKNFKDMVLLE